MLYKIGFNKNFKEFMRAGCTGGLVWQKRLFEFDKYFSEDNK